MRRVAARSIRNRSQIKRLLEATIRKEFPQDTVDISDGYKDNIHVLVVSRRFDEMKQQEKQDLFWDLIDSSGLRPNEKTLISLVLPVSLSQIK